jgi:hypothetical protein
VGVEPTRPCGHTVFKTGTIATYWLENPFAHDPQFQSVRGGSGSTSLLCVLSLSRHSGYACPSRDSNSDTLRRRCLKALRLPFRQTGIQHRDLCNGITAPSHL